MSSRAKTGTQFSLTLSLGSYLGHNVLTATYNRNWLQEKEYTTQKGMITGYLLFHIMLACLVAQLCPTLCDSMDCNPPGSSVHGDSPGKNTGVECQALLQGIFPTQGVNLCLLCLLGCRQILYPLSHQGSQRPQTDLGLVISVEQGTSASLHHPQSVGLYP